jgi:hypothetical protein
MIGLEIRVLYLLATIWNCAHGAALNHREIAVAVSNGPARLEPLETQAGLTVSQREEFTC